MEVWTATGNHRIVSIKCGHLFGKNCIEKWIARKPKESKCPQCNNPCSKRDIRQIYLPGKQLSAGTVDMAAYEDLAEQLRREKATRFQVENKYNQLTLTQKTFQDEIDYWKAEALRQKNELIAVKQKQLQIDQMLNEISSVSNSPQRSTLSNTPRRKLTSRASIT